MIRPRKKLLELALRRFAELDISHLDARDDNTTIYATNGTNLTLGMIREAKRLTLKTGKE